MYNDEEGAHGQRVGLAAKTGTGAPRTGETSVNGGPLGHLEAATTVAKIERVTSAGRATGTNASTVARDGQFPIQ